MNRIGHVILTSFEWNIVMLTSATLIKLPVDGSLNRCDTYVISTLNRNITHSIDSL